MKSFLSQLGAKGVDVSFTSFNPDANCDEDNTVYFVFDDVRPGIDDVLDYIFSIFHIVKITGIKLVYDETHKALSNVCGECYFYDEAPANCPEGKGCCGSICHHEMYVKPSRHSCDAFIRRTDSALFFTQGTL